MTFCPTSPESNDLLFGLTKSIFDLDVFQPFLMVKSDAINEHPCNMRLCQILVGVARRDVRIDTDRFVGLFLDAGVNINQKNRCDVFDVYLYKKDVRMLNFLVDRGFDEYLTSFFEDVGFSGQLCVAAALSETIKKYSDYANRIIMAGLKQSLVISKSTILFVFDIMVGQPPFLSENIMKTGMFFAFLDLTIAKLLYKHGAYINPEILKAACATGRIDFVAWLFSLPSLIFRQEDLDESLLYAVSSSQASRSCRLTDMLLKKGANPTLPVCKELLKTPNDDIILELILHSTHADVFVSAFVYYINRNHIEFVKSCIDLDIVTPYQIIEFAICYKNICPNDVTDYCFGMLYDELDCIKDLFALALDKGNADMIEFYLYDRLEVEDVFCGDFVQKILRAVINARQPQVLAVLIRKMKTVQIDDKLLQLASSHKKYKKCLDVLMMRGEMMGVSVVVEGEEEKK